MPAISALPPPTAPRAPPATDSTTPDPADPDAPDVPDISLADLSADGTGMSFADLLDIINPLQHIPIVSTIYRAITGDRIGTAARLLGGVLFGGPFGLAGAGIMLAFEQASGNTLDGRLAAMFQDVTGGGTPAEVVAVAAAPATGPDDRSPAASDIAPAAAGAGPGDQASAEPEFAPAAAGNPPRGAAVRPATSRSALLTPYPPAAARGRRVAAPDAPAMPPGPARAGAGRHVAQAIREAEKAQAELLIASLGSGLSLPFAGGDTTRRVFPLSVVPEVFAGHPNLMPPNAPPRWIGFAMERALMKYRQSSTLGAGRTTAAAPAR